MEIGDLQSLLASSGILVAHYLWLWRARGAGLDAALTARVSLAMVLAGLLGAAVFRLAYLPEQAATPWYDRIGRTGLSSFGGLAGGLATAMLILRGRVVPYLDALAFVFPAGWILGRAGCALAGDHPGMFPGGRPANLGLVELLFFLLFVIPLFAYWNRRSHRQGFWLGWLMILYGAFRLVQDQLHTDPPSYAGLSIDQWAYGAFFFSGAGVFLFSRLAAASEAGATNSRLTKLPDAS